MILYFIGEKPLDFIFISIKAFKLLVIIKIHFAAVSLGSFKHTQIM